MSILTPFRMLVVTALLTVIIFSSLHLSLQAYFPDSALRFGKTVNRPTKHDFVEEAVEHEVSDPFDIDAISQLCLSRPSNPGLVIDCVPGTGGVGNIRSYMLHCTRIAIEAGASMLLPSFHRRSKSDLSDLYGQLGDFEYYFDREHFINTLQSACPHLHIFDNPAAEWTFSEIEIPQWSLPIEVSSLVEPSPWRRQLDEWFEDNFASVAKPVVLRCGETGRSRAVKDDGMGFYYNFGRILRYRPDARRLAASCMAGIAEKFSLSMSPSKTLFENAYLGAHLRTSSDAVKAGWAPDFEGQTDWYIGQAIQHNLSVIFAAGGNDADLERFATKAVKQGISVVNKYDLLSGNDLREARNLLWDQRGLVDFEVLLKASQFGGFARSSFSNNVAFRRHFLSKVQDPFSDKNNHFADELSIVYGRYDLAWGEEGIRTMWP